MITLDYIRTFARYNAWQNASIYGAASLLSEADRKADRGAFFSSIHGTLSHLVWGDQIWMHRFAATGLPRATDIRASEHAYPDWEDLQRDRVSCDHVILEWAEQLQPAWLSRETGWFSGAVGRELTKPNWLLSAHMFNHQTHHRGQVHAMLTACGAKPADTDIAFMPD